MATQDGWRRSLTQFEKVLVANRGEIALRIMRTCRDMGLSTVAVYSDADADAPHVRFADEAVRLGPAPAAESYLDVEAILEAARRTNAHAIHPGYGFLAENAAFVERVEKTVGLVFIGPRAETVRAMGDKAAARALMASRGVPVVPGYSGDDQADARFAAEAERIGFPVLVKASAGGGGKGMSVVESAADLPAALAQARRLARGAFGDDRLLLERYIRRPRHIEVQILGDTHGRVIHVFERECSVQRRFQKIIEECPSPAVDARLRGRLCEAAITAGEALGYVGAGTVELILDEDGAFYFLEVNTRLQVEHPVTEMVTGLDLVRLQILVAEGAPLPEQADIVADGHAIECRLYAEDPAQDFLPCTGRVVDWAVPDLPHVRVDSGVERGSEISVYYDPLLAKVVAWAPTRYEAILRSAGALRRLGVQGLTTNRELLLAVLRHHAFRAGDLSTGFLREHLPGWAPAVDEAAARRRLVAAALADATEPRSRPLPALRPGWRNSPFRPARRHYAVGDGAPQVVDYTALGADRYEVVVGEQALAVHVLECAGERLRLEIDGVRAEFVVVRDGARRHVRDAGGATTFEAQPRFPDPGHAEEAGGCVAPMPGRVVRVLVAAGDEVRKGAALVILEAMKMEQTLYAPEDGVVSAVRVAEGQVVDGGAVLVELGSVSASSS